MTTTENERSSSETSEPEIPKAASALGDFKRIREGQYVTLPSGLSARIRFLNMEKHAMAGGMPSELRAIGLRGAAGVQEIFEDDDSLTERGKAMQEYLDSIVRELIVEPRFPEGEDLDEYLIPVDYRWCVRVALGEEAFDGEGVPLFGRERLSRFPKGGRKR